MKLPGRGLSWREFFHELKEEWMHDDLSNVAGAVTFSALLSIFPFLIFLVAVGSLFLGPHNETAAIDSISEVLPAEVAKLLSDRLHSLAGSQHSTSILTFGFIGTIWAASGGMAALMSALNTCYGVRETRPYWKRRGIALGMTMLAALLSILSAAATVALPVVASHMGDLGGLLQWLRFPFAAFAMMLLWAVLYYVLPDVEQEFKFITPGSVTGVLIWLFSSWLFSVYVSHFGKYDVTYGALATVIILLLWMWISAQVLLMGAEINAIIEHKSPDGKKVGARRMSDSGEDTTKTVKEREEARPIVVVQSAPTPPPKRLWVRNFLEAAAIATVFRMLFRRTRPT